jgi:hypothetical protein
MSETLYTAIAAAKKEFGAVVKNSTNPHFKSKYADLASVLDATEEVLSKHGLIIISRVQANGITTALVHVPTASEIDSFFPFAPGLDAQKLGASCTYGRRFSILALLNLAPEDDDGNQASQPIKTEPPFDAIKTATQAKEWIKGDLTTQQVSDGFKKFTALGDKFHKAGKDELYMEVLKLIDAKITVTPKPGEELF